MCKDGKRSSEVHVGKGGVRGVAYHLGEDTALG